MFVCTLVFICFAISPAVSAVTKNQSIYCSVSEFSCSDGTCISASLICDTNQDCPDGLDEALCNGASSDILAEDVFLNERFKRQSQCRIGEWQCKDGTCIPIDGKCDGTVDCSDKSDETHPLCRNSKCQPNWFRCTYGACVDGTAPCNGIVECADQSDELLPKCRNETDVSSGKFKCLDGNAIPAADYCDGIPDCPDGSDETVRACAAKTCPAYLFQCAYGACVDQKANCNGQRDCADGSDESVDLCNKMLPDTGPQFNKPVLSGKCVLPSYPEYGTYVVINAPYAKPGQGFQSLLLNVTCEPGYDVMGTGEIFCHEGSWSDPLPLCVRFCKLEDDPSVNYHCQVYGNIEGRRDCKTFEPSGTVVRPECNSPNYYSSTALPFMRCIDGVWDHPAICHPECGRLTPDGVDLIVNGRPALRGELPWHTGIYRKSKTPGRPHRQICGGSLVTNNVVISAAHCFWNDVGKQQPAANYAVAIGKLFRDWDSVNEADDVQKSDLIDIKIPSRFLGGSANFQEDIALLILKTPFVYRTYVRPVCLNFDVNFNRRQLKGGNLGKVAGWGLTGENGKPSKILRVVELPYVNIDECIKKTPKTFRENITGDKICAGYFNGTALCKGDSGGGLAFPETERGTERYYLRGIASTAPKSQNLCNLFTLTAFTQILRHEHYINQYL